MSAITTRKRRAFSAVPDDILGDQRLSMPARLVLAYLVGRPPDWETHVWQVCRFFQLSEARWSRIRRELEAAGYFRQRRLQDQSGRWVWLHEVFDEPQVEGEGVGAETSIPPKVGDGSIPRKPMDGQPIHGGPVHGKQGDITKEQYQTETEQEDDNSCGDVVAHFLESAGRDPGCPRADLTRALANATAEQATLAGKVWAQQAPRAKNPCGLAISLCQRASRGELHAPSPRRSAQHTHNELTPEIEQQIFERALRSVQQIGGGVADADVQQHARPGESWDAARRRLLRERGG